MKFEHTDHQELLAKYNKLLEFVKSIANRCGYRDSNEEFIMFYASKEIKAYELLQEMKNARTLQTF